jgi:protein phosphatase
MGTTLTAALIHDHMLYVAHVGDSSLYLFHDGQLTKITRDHTLAEQMISEGIINPGDLQVNSYNHILTRAVGVESSVEIDLHQAEVKTGDWILMCTDGLTDLVSEDELSNVLAEIREPQIMAEEMVAMALDKGGYDNITIVLLCV